MIRVVEEPAEVRIGVVDVRVGAAPPHLRRSHGSGRPGMGRLSLHFESGWRGLGDGVGGGEGSGSLGFAERGGGGLVGSKVKGEAMGRGWKGARLLGPASQGSPGAGWPVADVEGAHWRFASEWLARIPFPTFCTTAPFHVCLGWKVKESRISKGTFASQTMNQSLRDVQKQDSPQSGAYLFTERG